VLGSDGPFILPVMGLFEVADATASLGGWKRIMEAHRRRKVVHLTSVHDASDARIVHKECATLAAGGYEVVLVSAGEARSLPANVRHRPVPLPRNRWERFTRTMWHVYRAARAERANVYHFHDPELIVVGALLRLHGASVVFDVHEDIVLDIKTKPWIPSRLRSAVSAVAGGVLHVVQSWFTAIVPATPSIAQGFSHRRTIVVRNYPRLEELETNEPCQSFLDRPQTAIYLGSVTAVRGIEQMILAMAHPSMPPDARLLVAGEFEDAALRERASKLPGWSRVDAPGKLPRHALGAALNSARIGLLVLQPTASFELSLPTKLFEYMGVGLPVIGSKFLACCELLREHDCGLLVDPRDPAEIAAAMQFLLAHPERARAMGERGRQAVRGRYEWSSEARNLMGLYEEIA
jgi:glycosyltransferase involved in cell wall biosynthesis